MDHRQFLIASLVLASALALTAPGSAAPEVLRAEVVDAGTGEPITAAVVMMIASTANGAAVANREAETDGQGRFFIEAPSGLGGDIRLLVAVYKFGYVGWSNLASFRVVIGRPLFGGAPPQFAEVREDREIPDRIALAPFPANGWRPSHAIFLGLLVDADGRHADRPRFWQAIQRELDEARRQCGRDCE